MLDVMTLPDPAATPRDPRSFLQTPTDRDYVLGLVKTFNDHARDKNRTIYFVSITYKESNDYPVTAAAAHNHLKRFHLHFARKLCKTRHLELERFRKIEPILFAFIDVPGSKPKHYNSKTVPQQDSTFHHHCILIADQQYVDQLNALTVPAIADVCARELSEHCNIRTLNVQRVEHTEDALIRTTDYCTYHARKRNDDYAYQVFPISQSEHKK